MEARAPRMSIYWPTSRLTAEFAWAVKLAESVTQAQPASAPEGKIVGLLRVVPRRFLNGGVEMMLDAQEQVAWAMYEEQRGVQLFTVTHAARLRVPIDAHYATFEASGWLHLLTKACARKLAGAAVANERTEAITVSDCVCKLAACHAQVGR